MIGECPNQPITSFTMPLDCRPFSMSAATTTEDRKCGR